MEEILNNNSVFNNINDDYDIDLEFTVYIISLISMYLSNEQKNKFDNLTSKQHLKIIESLKLRRNTICNMTAIDVIALINKYINKFYDGN